MRVDRRGINVRHLGRLIVATVAYAAMSAAAAPQRSFEECRSTVLTTPRSLDGYACLLGQARLQRQRVLDFLEARLRQRPTDPRPRLYRALVRHFRGDAVPDEEWRLATEQFAREGDLTGEVYALTSHVGDRCFGRSNCDDAVRAMIWRADQLARRSGQPELRQLVEIWRLKYALTIDDLAGGEASETRLVALGEPAALWLRSEGLMARAHLAALLWDYPKERRLYGELIDKLDPADPRRALAMGGMAAATTQLALQGLESRERAEQLVREALEAEERVRADAYWSENGYLSNRVHLALLLGPTPEAIELLRSALAGQLARGWRQPLATMLSLGEWLATQPQPDLDGALGVADQAVEFAFRERGPWGLADTLLLRSRIRFLRGEVSAGVAEGLAALELLEGLREKQGDLPMRMRYAEPLSVSYHLVGGAMLEHREAVGPTAPAAAFQVMERLRARGLLETLLAQGEPVPPVPSVAQVQAALAPHEALVSFQVWRPEPAGQAPYRHGSSWATLITADSVDVVRIPDGDVLEPRIRAFVGLLEARDDAARRGGERLGSDLLQPLLSRLPPDVDSLVLVPDGALHRLPFDALSAGPGAPYLAEQFRLSVLPSGALWLKLRTGTPLAPGAALVLADPAVGDGAPLAVATERAVAANATLGVLRHARGEARAALAAFPRSSQLRTGAAASEAYLKSADLQGFSLLHLASHAVADANDPERSSVVLAEGAGEDGRLEPGEIARLPLRGRTVVLAGCETSAGTIRRGEGVMSLARAFFSAGAVTVVGTLNRARDDEAAAFFSELYRGLGRGDSMGEAVADAKRRLIARGAPPAAWANVVLLGDSLTRPTASESPDLGVLLTTAAVAAAAGTGAGFWRRRRR